MFEALAVRSPQSLPLIDSSIVRAHQHAAGGKRGPGSRHRPFSWRTSTKINVVVDKRGLPVRVALTPGQASDKAAVPDLIEVCVLAATWLPIVATTPAPSSN